MVCNAARPAHKTWTLHADQEFLAGLLHHLSRQTVKPHVGPEYARPAKQEHQDIGWIGECGGGGASHPPRAEYVLTEKGRALAPVIEALHS